ncbi:MAG: CBS domain-containing protein [Planctomycetes bacterium]|nr:CBS domain-containing protein [Planctomycetota bacterium]
MTRSSRPSKRSRLELNHGSDELAAPAGSKPAGPKRAGAGEIGAASAHEPPRTEHAEPEGVAALRLRALEARAQGPRPRRSLPLRARDLMERHVASVEEQTSVAQLAQIFDEEGVSGLPVIARDGRLLGIVSKTDLARALAEEGDSFLPAPTFDLESQDFEEDEESQDSIEPTIGREGRSTLCARDLMSESVVTASEDETAGELASRMLEHGIHRLLVQREGGLVGIVTATDLLAAVAEYESRLLPPA